MSINLLSRYLGKLGVDYSGLSTEEKATFNGWRDALVGRQLTDDDVKNFLDREYHETVAKLSATDNSKELDLFLKMKVDFITRTKEFLDTPAREKTMVENQIQQHLNT